MKKSLAKKIILPAILLALIIPMAFVLTGCGGGNTNIARHPDDGAATLANFNRITMDATTRDVTRILGSPTVNVRVMNVRTITWQGTNDDHTPFTVTIQFFDGSIATRVQVGLQ